MKKYLIALLFMPLFFYQCNPDENDTEQEGIYLSGRAYATGAKTEMTNQNGTGIISWSENDKFFSYAINTQNIFVEFRNENGGNVFKSEGVVVSGPGQKIRFYRIGESNLEVTMWSGPNNNIPVETQVNISIAEQSGDIEDFSKYHISKSNDVTVSQKKIGSGFSAVFENTFSDAIFTSMIAYANFDLSKYSDKEVVISVEGANNHFCFKSAASNADDKTPEEIFSQEEGTDGAITITNPSENTYIALLPSESSTLNFSVNGESIGSVTFPTDGIRANCFYTGANGKPIKIGGKVIVK